MIDVNAAKQPRFIEALPDLLKSSLGDVSKKAGGWCFLVLAGGPLPNDDNKPNLFEYVLPLSMSKFALTHHRLWVGPTSQAGYGFPDAYAPYMNEVRQPFSKFVTKVLG